MKRVRLLHWKAAEADGRLRHLRSAGFDASMVPTEMPVAFKQLRENPPDAVVIDLSRLPSAGRDVALSLRTYKSTRHVPLVFVDGEPEKVARIKQLLPDASYTGWDDIGSSLERAIANPLSEPVVPKSRLVGYAGTPLPKKLGIKEGSVVSLIAAPPGFKGTLGRLPDGVVVHNMVQTGADVTVWFVRSRRELENDIRRMTPLARKGALWIAWLKKGSGETTDLSQPAVRKAGLNAGIVDFKISSFDGKWSGLRFTSRRAKGQGARPKTPRK
jgi:hypothetical protein